MIQIKKRGRFERTLLDWTITYIGVSAHRMNRHRDRQTDMQVLRYIGRKLNVDMYVYVCMS